MLALAGCAALLAGAGEARAATTISTLPSWNGTESISAFGSSSTPTYGQTLVVPAGENTLSAFSFRLQGDPTFAFRGQVYAWDGAKATGPALWTSAPRSLTTAQQWEEVSFTTGGVAVTPGQEIVILATTVFESTGSGEASWGAIGDGDPSPGGQFVYSNYTSAASLTTVDWDGSGGGSVLGTDGDLAFTAEFGAAPVPPPAPTPGPASSAATPLVLGLSATTGSTAGGETITITGENFSDGTGVLFGNVPASAVTVHSARRLTVVTPAHDAGFTPMRVVNRSGTSAAAAFTFVAPAPPVTAEAPSTSVPAAQCAVPGLKGLGLPAARRKLAAAHCRLGKVTVTGKRGRQVITTQSQPAGTILAAGATVDVTAKRTKG